MITLLKKTKYRVQNHLLNWLLLFFAASLFVGCNNKTDQQTGTQDSTSSTTTDDTTTANTKAAFNVDPQLDVLYTDSVTLSKFFETPGNEKKWVLKFCISDSSAGDLTLSIWPERNRRYTLGSLILSTGADTEVDLGNTSLYVGDQRLKISEVKQITTALAVKDGKNYIIFEPTKKVITLGTNSYNVIYYHISLSDVAPTSSSFKTTALVFVTDSNPSPPAAAHDDQD